MGRRRKYGLSFSWRRATGYSAAKGRLSRKIGIPLTRSGRQRKVGRALGCLLPISFVLLVTLTCLIAFTVCAQETNDKPQPDRWRGLILDQSTPEDAIRVLGRPAKDSMSRLPADPIGNWLTKRHKESIFRALEFKKPEGIDKAWLFFLDGKVVEIMLDVKKGISPAGLSNIYGIQFRPVINAMDIAFRPQDYERNQGQVYPKTYPTVYHMVGISSASFVTAMISNVPSFGGALAQSMGIPDAPGSLPGRVQFVTLISRSLENKDGSNVLK